MSPTQSSESFKPFTWRVENIPDETSPEALLECFDREDQQWLKVKSVCPSVDTPEGEEGDLTATVFFHPPEPTERPPRIATDDMMTIDREFFGFTPLYTPPVGKGPIVADIIAVTGLAGHAYGSWAHSPERMWLRDYLPRDAPNTRILTYGYPSKLQASNSVTILQDHTNTFVHRLIDMRESAQCESRPIIFIGHSLGCLIIKKALTGLENMGITRSRLPVRAFIFLGAPHRGLNVTALQTLVKGEPTEKLIAELKAESATLTDLNRGFAHIARDIDILTCYETRSTRTAINVNGVWKREGPLEMMVSPDSAQQYYFKEKCVSVDADHSQIAKLKRGQNGVYPNVKSAIKHGLISTAKIMAGADSGADPKAIVAKELAKVQISEDHELPPQPPPYTPTSSTNSIPGRPLTGRAASSSQVHSPIVTEIKPETLVGLEADDYGDRNRNISRTSTRTSVGTEALAELGRTHSLGENLPAARVHISPEPSMRSRSITESHTSKQGVLQGHSKASNTGQPVQDSKNDCFCKACSRNITHDEFYYTCDDCVPDGWEDEAGFGRQVNSTRNDAGNVESNKRKDETSDDAYDVCQNCFASGAQGRDHPGHKFGKRMIVSYGQSVAIFPYPERQVSMYDSNIVKALKEGDGAKLIQAIRNGDNVNAYDTDGNTPVHLAIDLGLTSCVEILLNAGAPRETRDRADLTPLLNAVLYNQLEIIPILLNQGADINAPGGMYSDTPLHLAAMNGQHEIIGILLSKGAKINALSTVGTPLFYAANRGDRQSVSLLLESGANVNLQVEDQEIEQGTPLIGAATAGKPETMELLKNHGARIEDHTSDGMTALMHAALTGHLECCETLLRMGASARAKNSDGRSVVFIAAQANKSEIVELLVKHNADVDEPNDDGTTPLMLAIESNQVEMAKLLRRCGGKIDKFDGDGVTLMMKAIAANEVDKVELLLKHGAKVDNPAADGITPLMHATKANKPDMVKLLLRSGAKVDKPDSTRETPLEYSVIEGYAEVCEELLKGKAEVDRYFTTAGKQTPLMKATMANKSEVVRVLLKYGAKVDAADSKGETPLVYAVVEGWTEVCEELLRGKADVDQLTPLGATVLMRAVQCNKPKVVKLLLKYGAKVDMPDINSETPLIYGAIEAFAECCEELLAGGADVDQFMSSGDTPLMKVTRLNKIDMVKLFIKHGAMVDKPEQKSGETPLIYAVIEGYCDICEALLSSGAYVEQTSTSGSTALMKAVINDKPEVVTVLLRHGAKVDKPVKGETPLIYAAIEGYTACCEALLLGNADVNQYMPTGPTPLFKAVVHNKPSVVKLLLKYGAKPDLPEKESGETPLIHGLLEEHIEACEALLDKKADVEQVTRYGNTPLMASAMNGKLESVRLLMRYNPVVDRMPVPDGWTALTLAAHSGHYAVVRYLLSCGASGAPPPTWGKWKNFRFNDSVEYSTQGSILQLLREYKHR